ncbi:integrase catalytic domain-containing protein [Trichonephila clavipes]|nr:integrase catalytic domain-containing protein [Trichonephila clavipes]
MHLTFCRQSYCLTTVYLRRLAEHFHLKNHRAGMQLLLIIIREKYWLMGGRRTVRKIWNACVKCQRSKSKSPMTDPVSLPSDRVKDAVVFEAVGVDLAGPLYVSNGVIRFRLSSVTVPSIVRCTSN